MIASLALTGCATPPYSGGKMPLQAGARYVAMGSSFAAGPGIDPDEEPKTRCSRSTRNYAQQLAEKRGLELIDVSCSGAKTAHVLGTWNELRPQIDAVTSNTKLVTITIGGNDVNYVGSLIGESCRANATGAASWCPAATYASEEDWAALSASLARIIAAIRQRAPDAQIVFVDYITLLPAAGTCEAAKMDEAQADRMRAVAKRLAEVTFRAAREGSARVLRISDLSVAHSPCDNVPWATGFPYKRGPRVLAPYHPTLEGMTAIAQSLDQMLP